MATYQHEHKGVRASLGRRALFAVLCALLSTLLVTAHPAWASEGDATIPDKSGTDVSLVTPDSDIAGILDQPASPEQEQEAAREEQLTEEEAETLVRSGLSLRSAQKVLQFMAPYSDAHFLKPATSYQPDLARMSICLATSANRPIPFDSSVVLDPDEHLREYLEDSGFTNIRSDDYDKTPSIYTVASAMGSKTLVDESGNSFTLLAVGICGGNYKLEWQSNMTIGTGTRHQGFDSAARAVTDRIFGYLGTHHITGRIKVWISGFSRAAAVTNLTAANLVDSGMFATEDVYAYTFATPRTTKDYDAKDYGDIFNVVGPFDIVPQVSPKAWGYGRYGTTLLLPSQECNSDFLKYYRVIQEGFEQIFGSETYYNPKINLCLRVLLGMSEQLIPSAEDYDNVAHANILSLLEDKTPQNALRVLRKVTVAAKDDPASSRAVKDAMVQSIIRLTQELADAPGSLEEGVNPGSNVARVMHEHIEDLYLMWVMLDDSSEALYEGPESFSYLLVSGDANLTVEDAQSGNVLCELEPNGTLTTPFDEPENEMHPYASTLTLKGSDEDISLVILPHDVDYRVTWNANKQGPLTSHVIACTTDITPTYDVLTRHWEAAEGDAGILYEGHGEQVESPGSQAETLTSTDIAQLIGLSDSDNSWQIEVMKVVMFACIAFTILRAIYSILNHIGEHERWKLRFLLSSIVIACGIEGETAYWIFAADPLIRLLWKMGAGLALILYCIECVRSKDPRSLGLVATIALCVVGDLAIIVKLLPGLILFGLSHVALVAFCLFTRRMKGRKWFWWILSCLILMPLVLDAARRYDQEATYGLVVGMATLLLVLFAGTSQQGSLRDGSIMLVVSDLLLFYYHVNQSVPYAHMAASVLFYIALSTISRAMIAKTEKTVLDAPRVMPEQVEPEPAA